MAVADATLDALEQAGIATVAPEHRRAGYATAVWPGRLELIEVAGRDVLLDGAHNPAGAAALAVALDDIRPYLTGGGTAQADRPRVTLVTAAMADKDVAGVAAALARSEALEGARIICCSLDVPRALPADRLAAIWAAEDGSRTIDVEPDAGVALDRALADGSGPVVVAGSLYLVGAIRARLVDDPLLRDGEEPGA